MPDEVTCSAVFRSHMGFRMYRSHRFVRCCLLAALSCVQLTQSGCKASCRTGTSLKDGICVSSQTNAATAGDGAPLTDPTAAGAASTSQTNAAISGAPSTMATGGAGTAASNPGDARNAVPAGPSAQAGAGAAADSSDPAQTNSGATPSQGAPSNSNPAASDAGSPNMSMTVDSGPGCTPLPEECDGQDNDCDTAVDEEIEPMSCGIDRGICKPGTIQCRNGQWEDPETQCEGAVGPATEECDAARLDEDCNGIPNDGCACTDGETMECGEGPFTCTKGTVTCRDGELSACTGEQKGSAEKCDGEDNDCDGTPDNGGDRLCSGAARFCDGRAGCVACRTPNDCSHSTCEVATCVSGVCGTSDAPRDTRCASGGTVCNGNGQCVACNADSDCADQVQADECNEAACEAGRCSTKPQAGKTCEGGGMCTASGTCAAPQRTLFSLCSSGSDSTCPTAGSGFCHQGGFCSRACSSDGDCGGFPGFCSGSICFPECSPSGTCPNGLQCNTGFKPPKSDGSEPNGVCAK
jgi:hypothetical protein